MITAVVNSRPASTNRTQSGRFPWHKRPFGTLAPDGKKAYYYENNKGEVVTNGLMTALKKIQ
jgi:hypothetical protein